MNRLARHLHRVDSALAEHISEFDYPELDITMKRTSGIANFGVLWWIVAFILGALGGKARRGAVRGLLALLLSSALTNGVLKRLFPRRRPPAREWRNHHRGVPIPASSAFPSGHSASAVAFATGVALESPLAGAAIAPIAAAVAYSRVHNGVHWPGDVLAGAAVGAAAALATRRWWAVRSDEPADAGPQRRVRPLARGAGLVIYANSSSGPDGADLTAQILEHLPDARLVELDTSRDFTAQIDDDIAREQPAALGVAGGDGTIVVVASAAQRHSLPLAVFPAGTFNHFARDVGAASIADTAQAIETGTAAAIDSAHVHTEDGRSDTGQVHTFLNTSSLGGYPDAVRLRERWEPRMGKWLAAAIAMTRVLVAAEPLSVTIDDRDLQVWMLFVGNGRYSPGDQVPMSRPSITGGVLDVRYLRADRRLSRARLLFVAATGTLGYSRVYSRRLVDTVSVRVHGRRVALATDGEVVDDARQFTFTSDPQTLTVYRLDT